MPTDQIQNKQIQEALQKLNKSQVFSGSERNMRILRFLVDCYLNGTYVKESVIALELFSDSDPSSALDGKVRGYMFTLRKKLEDYYEHDGINDAIRFSVKKGQYNLSVDTFEVKQNRRPKKLQIAVVAIIVLLFIAIAIIQSISKKESYLWKPFVEKNASNLLCVGDHLTIIGNVFEGKRISFYDANINSMTDFTNLTKALTDSSIELNKADYSFATKMGPIGAAKIATWLNNNHADLDVLMESELSLDNLNDNNIIYIGPFRILDKLRNLFLSKSEVFDFSDYSIIDKQKGIIYENKQHQRLREEHVMVSFHRHTDSGHYILFIAGNNDIGVLSLVKNLTNPDWLKEFYKNLPSADAQFNALFKVSGVVRTDLSCELVDIEILNQ